MAAPAGSEHPNVVRLREGYEAFAKGDLSVLDDLWADDFSLSIPGRTDLAGTYQGRPAAYEFLRTIMERSEGSFRLEPQAIFADDTTGVAVVRLTGRRGDRTLDTLNAHVCRLDGGRVTELRDAATDPEALDAFFA